VVALSVFVRPQQKLRNFSFATFSEFFSSILAAKRASFWGAFFIAVLSPGFVLGATQPSHTHSVQNAIGTATLEIGTCDSNGLAG